MSVSTPLEFTLSDPARGGRLVGEIVNCRDYVVGDILIIIDVSTSSVVATGDATVGIVNIFGLTNDTPFTGLARVSSGAEISADSNEATETPTNTILEPIQPDFGFFERLRVTFDMGGGTVVEWPLNSQDGFTQPFTFFLQFSNQAAQDSDTWEDAAVVVDECIATDPEKRIFGGLNQFAYYRILLRDANGREAFSMVQQAAGNASRHDFLLARDVVRKEGLRLVRFSGIKGYLRKVRKFGDVCTVCVDPDTDEVTDSDCLVCFGTGIVGGYHNAIEFFADLGLRVRDASTDVNYGPMQNVVLQSRCLGTPELSFGDLWIRADTDERYFVQEVQDVVRLIESLVVMANLRRIPVDDIAYQVPRPT